MPSLKLEFPILISKKLFPTFILKNLILKLKTLDQFHRNNKKKMLKHFAKQKEIRQDCLVSTSFIFLNICTRKIFCSTKQ